jgi:hypothetical protein
LHPVAASALQTDGAVNLQRNVVDLPNAH